MKEKQRIIYFLHVYLLLLFQMLRERLFPLIQRIYPDLAGKITSMLLEMDNKELLFLLKSQDSLKAKVEEAVAMLHADKAKEDDSIDEDDRQRSDLSLIHI